MHPGARLGITLLVSLALWSPTAGAALAGRVDLTTSAMRYLAALGVSWLAIAALDRLVTSYASAASGSATSTGGDPTSATRPSRRRDDPTHPTPAAPPEGPAPR